MQTNHYEVHIVHSEKKEKNQAQSTHSTDTEPEAEVEVVIENRNHNINSDSRIKYEINNGEKARRKCKNGFTRFIEKLPSYEYDHPKKLLDVSNINIKSQINTTVPFDIRETDNNRFVSYSEAFLYVAQHCQKYNIRYTRDKCREFLKNCYIIDFSHDEFIPVTTSLTKKEFNKHFLQTQRELKFI